MMFQDSSCGRFTVPSCVEHNTHKSGDDAAVMSLLLREVHGRLKDEISQNQMQLLDRHSRRLAETKQRIMEQSRNVSEKRMIQDHPGFVDRPVPYIDRSSILYKWMRQLTAALVWTATGTHDNGIEWSKAFVFCDRFIPESDTALMTLADVAHRLEHRREERRYIDRFASLWSAGWTPPNGQYPRDIYRFEVSLVPSCDLTDDGSLLIVFFRHFFFGDQAWYVGFTTSRATKDELSRLLRPLSD